MRNRVGQVTFLGSFGHDLPVLNLPEVAFAGRSNVGKSSALNRLLKRKKAARVSQRPGRTQRINLFNVGDALCFADLPGYGFAKVPKQVQAAWHSMMDSYFSTRRDLCLTIVIVDVRRDPQALDLQMLASLNQHGLPSLVVATKADKLSKQNIRKQLGKLEKTCALLPGQIIAFSAVTGMGQDAVWEAIEEACAPVGP